MKEIIINQPHLQSLQQKCGAAVVTTLSWLLWGYFLLPLFTLGGWLLGVKSLSDEIRWFGGYKTLLELLQLYGLIVLVIALLWLFWTIYITWLHSTTEIKAQSAVSDQQLCEVFKVDEYTLVNARKQGKVTVYFDSHAVIVAINQK